MQYRIKYNSQSRLREDVSRQPDRQMQYRIKCSSHSRWRGGVSRQPDRQVQHRIKCSSHPSGAEETKAQSEWGELLGIFKTIAPFASLIWSAALCWALSESIWMTAFVPIAATAIVFASLFCNQTTVRIAWSAAFCLVLTVILIAAIGFTLYYGAITAATATAWIAMFPLRHPLYFIGGIAVLLVIGIASSVEDPKATTMLTKEPPLVHDRNANIDRSQKKKNSRKRKTWSIDTRIEVWERCKRCCYYCNETLESWRGIHMHLDHVKPISKNGSDAVANLVASCPCCNYEKHDKTLPGI